MQGPVHLRLAYSSYIYPISTYIPSLHISHLCLWLYTTVLCCWDCASPLCKYHADMVGQGSPHPHWVSCEVSPSWHAGAGGRKNSYICLPWAWSTAAQELSHVQGWMRCDTRVSVPVPTQMGKESPICPPIATAEPFGDSVPKPCPWLNPSVCLPRGPQQSPEFQPLTPNSFCKIKAKSN